jgi:acetolactate synthase-1/2/3 large subunit
MKSIGEALIDHLVSHDVDIVFGIPGVHTVELYRGLASSTIRHVTARHEQGAGFMADGYARVSGKAGVAFVITGPGLTNTLTPMAQARADSIPMLIISSVNATYNLDQLHGHLHELPDQLALAKTLALESTRILNADDLAPAIENAYQILETERGGPVHLEIPLDVMALPFEAKNASNATHSYNDVTDTKNTDITAAISLLEQAKKPVILAGGGARYCNELITKIAERLDAPVIQSVNARGLMHAHPLCVPASPSLDAVRDLIKDADVVLGLGTELGETDIDMYQNGTFPELKNFIRIDICADQLARRPYRIGICGKLEKILPEMISGLSQTKSMTGTMRAEKARSGALAALDDNTVEQLKFLHTLRDCFPESIMVGDSTQPIYAGNLYYDHDRPAGWFNAATGYGALGYAFPAAIGAALAKPDAQVICLIGDGGAQFTLTELMTAVDEKLPILFIVWNNNGYGEIETSMLAAGVEVVGCDPTAPNFKYIAAACDMPFQSCGLNAQKLKTTLQEMDLSAGPVLVEIKIDA